MNKKYFLHCFLVILSLFLLTGCSDKKSEDAKKKGKGRYIETELEVPKKNDRTKIITQTFLKDGSYVVYTADVSDSNNFSITRYQYNDNMTSYKKESPEWMQDVPAKDASWGIQILHGKNDTEYLCWYDKGGISICRTLDGKARKKIKVEGWNALTSDGKRRITPLSVGILGNDMIAAGMFDGVYVYDIKTGRIKQQLEEPNLVEMTVFGNKLVAIRGDNSGEETMTSLAIYDADNLAADPEEIVFETPVPVSTTVGIYKNDIILANGNGIHLLKDGTSSWQTVVDGSMNCMYIPSTICDTVLRDKESNYFILYANDEDGNSSIKKYNFDKTINAVPSQELTIYTLQENPLLRAAAYDFQKKHPDFKVTIRVAMAEDSGLSKEDYIRSLNTELLSGKGCDLILLDGLPVDSYIEKGSLSDISSLVDPLMKNKELLTNVVGNYYMQEKIYAIPVGIQIPIVYGKSDEVAFADKIDKLAEYAGKTKGNPLFGAYTYENMIEEFLPCYMHKIMTSNKQIDQGNLRLFLKDIKIILNRTGCIPEYTKENNKKFEYDLPVSTSLYKETTKDFFGAGMRLSSMHFVKGDFTTLENSFVPVSIIGINKSSKYQDLAKEFIGYLLSDKMQRVVNDETGFPIRVDTLENLESPQYWFDDFEITYEDGTKGYVPYIDMMDSDKKKIIRFCKTVTEQAYVDDNIIKAILEGGKGYILGDESIDKTVEKIQNKLSLYSEE